MLEDYINGITEHLQELDEELVELAKISQVGSLTKFEFRAAERLLQLYVEACIGIAKHCIKKAEKIVPSDAYSSFEKLAHIGVIKPEEVTSWRKIIGLRNVLVHDYLNVDNRIVQTILENQKFKDLKSFSVLGIEYLAKNTD